MEGERFTLSDLRRPPPVQPQDLMHAAPKVGVEPNPLFLQPIPTSAMTPDDTSPRPIRTLSPADAAAVDAMVASRATGVDSVGLVPAGASQRALAAGKLLGLLEAGWRAEEPSADLADRTMQRMIDERQRRRFSIQIAQAAGGGAVGPRGVLGGDGRFQWRQLTAAAAMVLIALSLLLPVLSRVRTGARQSACSQSLATAGMGFTGFARDHDDTLPRYEPGQVWWKIGRPSSVTADGRSNSNSANLYLLVRRRYVEPVGLTCPENSAVRPDLMTATQVDWPTPDAVSFSYQNQATARPIRLTSVPLIPLLADRNPLFMVDGKVLRTASCGEAAPSQSHQARGQNMLYSDGSVAWTLGPRVQRMGGGGDNIWTMAGVPYERVAGNEPAPDPTVDSFLSP